MTSRTSTSPPSGGTSARPNQLTVNGKCYLQLNYIPYTGMLFTHCMFYNHRLAEKYLTESMYDLVRNGKWTIDKFLEVTENATQDINGDSKYDENDNYGFMASFGSVGIFTYSCDQDMVSVSKDGEVKIEIYTEKMQDIVEKVNKLCYEGNRSYVKGVNKEADIAKMFAERSEPVLRRIPVRRAALLPRYEGRLRYASVPEV